MSRCGRPLVNKGPVHRLRQLVGQERSLGEVAQAVHFFALSMNATAVGAMHVTCADESEYECVDALQSHQVCCGDDQARIAL